MLPFLENYLNEIEMEDDFYYNPTSLLPKVRKLSFDVKLPTYIFISCCY